MPVVSCEPLRIWSRLEVRPRQVDLDRCLEARIQDPLWMLTRQWQFGEFHGSDTGSAVTAAVARHVTAITSLQFGSDPTAGPPDPASADQQYDPELPLEPQVEALPIRFPPNVRAQIGEYLLSLLTQRLPAGAPIAAYRGALLTHYPIELTQPVDPLGEARKRVAGRAYRLTSALAGRSFDGVALAEALPGTVTLGDLPSELAGLVTVDVAPALLSAVAEFVTWFAATYGTTTDSSWSGERLDYDYRVTTESGLTLRGRSTSSGRLDWYGFHIESGTHDPAPDWEVACAIPRMVSYAGMPSARWWELEDAAVSLSGLRADSTDVAKIIVTEFALVFGNDWLEIPYDQALGSLAQIGGIVVTDVFGVRTLVGPATGSAGEDWAAWDMFSLSPAGPGTGVPPLGQHLFLPPSAGIIQDGTDFEEVTFVRDEDANMVWAIEAQVADGAGGARDGSEAAHRMAAALAELADLNDDEDANGTTTSTTSAALRYLLGTPVPENWIPFVPVHRPQDTHAVRLQRAWTPRDFPSGSRVRPLTSILGFGIAGDDQTDPYFVNEEEVPRAGTRVTAAMRRARWGNGATSVWHSRRTGSGRGEVSSGLRFDVIEPSGPAKGGEATAPVIR